MAYVQANIVTAAPKETTFDKINKGVGLAMNIMSTIKQAKDTFGGTKKDLLSESQVKHNNAETTKLETENKFRTDHGGFSPSELAANNAREKDLYVPGIGTAINADDAKNLKDAAGVKNAFDRKIDAMIALRTKHGGGTIWNRDDVALGKQLASEALVDYKAMAKLGVLSDSDTKLINKVIPEDPLAYAWTADGDPIGAKLAGLKSGTDEDYKKNVSLRLKTGPLGKLLAGDKPPKDPGDIQTKAAELLQKRQMEKARR
jgi:hypothetical protein